MFKKECGFLNEVYFLLLKKKNVCACVHVHARAGMHSNYMLYHGQSYLSCLVFLYMPHLGP